MNYKNVKVGELKELADFYTVEPKVADAEHGPTKKELLAALAEAKVSDEDYNKFLEAKAVGTNKTEGEKEQEGPVESDEEVEAEEVPAVVEEQDGADDEVLVKMTRKNGTYEAYGYRFSKRHPFKSVPASVAERLVEEEEGFCLALPSEVKDYYN